MSEANRVIELPPESFSRKEERVSAVATVPTGGAVTPMHMLHLAVQQGADIEKMKQLMELQERWEANEARKAFVAALSAFKANPPEILKNKHVKIPHKDRGGFTEYDHATLDHVSAEIGKALSVHGLSHRWNVEQLDGGMIRVTCVLTHALGHAERVSMQASADQSGSKNNIQALGSTVTYLQRYTLLAATGTAVKGQDNDGAVGGESNLAEGAVADHLAAIDGAATEADLKKCFGAAWKAGESAGDKGAMRLFTEHKDARKKALGKKS